MELTLVHLYPDLLNLYGDRGNIIVLKRRCEWRDIMLHVVEVSLKDPFPRECDLIFIGGDQDREQQVVADDLRRLKGEAIVRAIEEGLPALAVCGGYQLFQRSYVPATGPAMLGLGIFDAETRHPGPASERYIGNLAVQWEGGTLIGFENHGGRTFLGPSTKAFARVLKGYGNNGQDSQEGAQAGNAIGTYMHGSLLPKNPALADHLIACALRPKYGEVALKPLDDHVEMRAHDRVLRRTLAGR